MLTWNVYIDDFNARRIKTMNIFEHASFLSDCKEATKKCGDDFAAFEARIRRSLMYYFWSKCEYEIILNGWPPRDDYHDEKIDVYDQVRLNWPVFINWLWENRKEIAKKKGTK